MKLPDERLVGTWVAEEEDSNAAFSISIRSGVYEVTGVDQADGELFEIENVVWDGSALSFTATMPSTGFCSKNVFRIRPDGKAELELTIFETWKKKQG